jgi:outer membrane protein assembly factor BamB
LAPRPWAQIHSDKENSGFNPVNSPPARPLLRKWVAQVGPLAFASPVIGPDGVIYVGNANGELVAIRPDGTEFWRRKLATSILSTPAVNTDTGDIIVLAQEPSSNGALASKLYRVTSTAALPAVSAETIPTSAAPKLWGNYVFVSSGTGRLRVFDQASLVLIGQIDANECFNIVCGSGPSVLGWTQDILDFLECIVDGAEACVGAVPPEGPAPGPIIEPSVAIVDAATLVADPNLPTVVMIGPQCASAYRFYPAGDAPAVTPPQDRHFETLWSRALVPVDCEFRTIRSTTPAAILGGQVIFNTFGEGFGGTLISLDLLTGNQLWSFPVGAAQSPPVASVRQVYLVTNLNLWVFDSDGAFLNLKSLLGRGENAAISASFVYATTTRGVHTFTQPDPTTDFFFGAIDGNNTASGASFPILGEDGTVYVSSPDGLLQAYGPETVGTLPAVFAGLNWQTPTNGATLQSAPGQTLSVSVTGGFSGTVAFISDIDGTLCETAVTDSTATCVTNRPLTIGTHVLTAFAADAGGGTRTAEITIQVVSTPPTVSIASPAANAVVSQSASIAFAAVVSDPDQASFAPEAVRWQSSLDSDLGTGLTLTRSLSAGTHTITVTATDAGGAATSASQTLQVIAEPGPTATIQQPAADAVFQQGSSITFTATVSDPNQASFAADQIRWTSNIDGEIGTGLTFARTLSLGTHTIVVTATNDNGTSGTAAVTIRVAAGPSVTILQPENGAILFSGTPITFSATVTDSLEPAFPPENIRWTSDLDGELGTGPSISQPLSNGNHTITCTATDTFGLTGQASVQVTVQPPVL